MQEHHHFFIHLMFDNFLIMFLVYPSIASGLFSMFYCVPLEDGTSASTGGGPLGSYDL